ncbi:MAG TPA: ubiquinone biosynthesis protein UbiE [Spirochaetia bacterium]|nr:MAG: hypothetical protein A2Y41_04150 [Spirochaetes bacterium GWB1_36_13]HCL58158.1 ubiquinone biosynthesis protein UbiE [Spirochaetia bacterium]
MLTLETVKKRYDNEKSEGSLGCANISSFLNIREGEIILELGSGRGLQTILSARQSGDKGMVYGLDLSEKMVEKANESLKDSELKNLKFLTGDLHRLPFENQSFDLIYSNCVLNHSTDKLKAYQEIFRVLKPGGKIVIGDITAVHRLPESVSNDPEAIADCYGGAIPKKEYEEIILSAGFQKINIHSSRIYEKNGFLLESIIITGGRS